MAIKQRQHRYFSSVKLWIQSKVLFNLLIFLNRVLSASVSLIYACFKHGWWDWQTFDVSKTITVLAKRLLLTPKLMMCWVASYQVYTNIFVLTWRKRKLFGSFTAFNLSSLLTCAWPKPWHLTCSGQQRIASNSFISALKIFDERTI